MQGSFFAFAESVKRLLGSLRFSKEYLNGLRQMNMCRKQSTSGSRDLVLGDVVLIKEDEPAPQTQWRIDKIIKHPVQKPIAFESAERVAERERSDERERERDGWA